ncbi:MAG TPA: ribonuclease J [Oscillospiraceae bacterium]|nr:ribonuclease J [Oscillospiraceae bacterium]
MQNSKKKAQGKTVRRKPISAPTKDETAAKNTKKTPAYGKVKRTTDSADTVKISFLGGINEVGKNMTAYTYGDDIILVDCGLAFPDTEMFGVDLVIPDFTFVERNKANIKGVVITHGHEDHIGGLVYMLKSVNVPVYATRLTAGLIKGKLKEARIASTTKIHEVAPGDTISLGKFDVEFIKVNHSIPDAVALSISCGAGVIIQTGDFKVDTTPIDGEMINLSRFAQLGNEGVLCLLSDSTNSESPGYSQSESKVGESFENLFTKADDRRIIIATFASNIHRVQQIINIAKRADRKVALSGRSLENVVGIASELGYLDVPEGVLIGIGDIKKYPDEKLVIVTTGSQGETMSALSRMSMGEHRQVEIGENDYIIISAKPIPGNEKTVFKVINDLMRLGAEIIYEQMYDVHVSGHAYQEELRLLLTIVKPDYFIPVHGEQKHLRRHAALAKEVGIPKENILITDNGREVSVSEKGIFVTGSIPAGGVFVDGYGVGDVGNIVMRDRRHLGMDGVITVTAAVDASSGKLLSGPEVVSRGFIFVRESEALINQVAQRTTAIIESFPPYSFDALAMKSKIKDEISRLMYEKTKRSPMVLAVVLEV